MNRKCIKVAKANNYQGLFIRHTFVKRSYILILGLKTDGRITRYCDRIRKMVKLTIAE